MNRKRLDNHGLTLHNPMSATFQRLFASQEMDDSYKITPKELVEFVNSGKMTVKRAQIILEEVYGCKFDD